MFEILNDVEARVVGALVEKQLSTPEYYPLTLNALTAACNQKSNRDPVTAYDDGSILPAIENLREKNLVYVFYGSTSRVVKYKHMLPGVFDLSHAETALLCVLILRGPQTLGELRERTGRLYEFSGIGEVKQTLDGLAGREEPLVMALERRPGQKEARFAHLLSGPVESSGEDPPTGSVAAVTNVTDDPVTKLQNDVERLSAELENFRQTFEEFKKQFD